MEACLTKGLTVRKLLMAVLLIAVIALQSRLWVGEGSLVMVNMLQGKVEEKQKEIEQLKKRNNVLAAELDALKSGDLVIEQRARTDLGMIKNNETFYLIVDEKETEAKSLK